MPNTSKLWMRLTLSEHLNLKILISEVNEFSRLHKKLSLKPSIQGKNLLFYLVFSYGFLSENAKFVDQLEKENIVINMQ